MRFRKDEGFTLVELMVVVLIIGILVAIAIPVFNAARGTAEERSCFANQRTLEGAAQTYAADDGGSLVDLTVATLVTEGFVKVAPECPELEVGYTFDQTSDDGTVVGCTSHGHFLD